MTREGSKFSHDEQRKLLPSRRCYSQHFAQEQRGQREPKGDARKHSASTSELTGKSYRVLSSHYEFACLFGRYRAYRISQWNAINLHPVVSSVIREGKDLLGAEHVILFLYVSIATSFVCKFRLIDRRMSR